MFSLEVFRRLYPQFAEISDEQVLDTADQAECFLTSYGCKCTDQMLILMVAHLLALGIKERDGGVAGQVTGATVDKVSVSIAPPPSRDMWSYWLGLTPYGMQLMALLKVCTAGGLYVGGLPERAAFRSVGGIFPRGGRLWRR